MKAYAVYPTYRTNLNPETGREESFVLLFGRLENGESFMSKTPFRPYFWIPKKDLEKAHKLAKNTLFDTATPGYRNFKGEEVAQIILDTPKQVPDLRRIFEDHKISVYEADIRFAYRFMMDKGILGSFDIEGTFTKGDYVDRIYDDPTITPASWFPQLKVLSIDIETNLTADEFWAVSMHTEGYSHVFVLSSKEWKGATSFTDQGALLSAFRDKVKELDPDIIVGWNLIDFDLKVIQEQFKKHKIDFFLGRANSSCSLKIFDDFFRESTADIPGRQALDGIALLKNAFIKLDDYKLSTAAKVFLHDDKLIGEENKGEQIEFAYKKNTQLFIDYNLKDSVLAYDIIKKTGTLDLAIQRSLLTGMPIERVRASIASLDSLYIRELNKRKIVAPPAGMSDKDEDTKGGFVMKSEPGIYDYVIVHDFKSLYPSIIRTFNIDPYSFAGMHAKGKNIVTVVNGASFRNEDGILPSLIQRLWESRDRAKKEKNARASQAIKILMNSFYGVLANPTCRFFSPELANAITHTGQHLIKLSADKVREMGYDVIYGDTDSIFTHTKAKDEKEAEEIGKKIQENINAFYKKHIKETYHRENFMELEFEKVFIKFMMPTVRNSTVGAKKRYAGIIRQDGKEKIVFTGLEFVRSDWTELAKKFQMELLDKIFHEKEVAKYVKDFIDDLQKGKYDSLLVYRKSIRKGLEEYTKTTPPHVKAARLLEQAGKKIESTTIRYVMTTAGPEPIEMQKHKIDYEHYIDKQIKPIADSVLSFYDTTFNDLMKNSKQQTLFGY
jgi:DNA polymerase-2